MKTAWSRGDELVLTAALALLLWVSLSSARLMEADREKDMQSVILLLLMPGSAVPITPPPVPADLVSTSRLRKRSSGQPLLTNGLFRK